MHGCEHTSINAQFTHNRTQTREAGIIFVRRKGELLSPLVKTVLLWTIQQTLIYIKLAVKDEVATFLTTLRQSKIPAFRMG